MACPWPGGKENDVKTVGELADRVKESYGGKNCLLSFCAGLEIILILELLLSRRGIHAV
jgi:hypothetical protein